MLPIVGLVAFLLAGQPPVQTPVPPPAGAAQVKPAPAPPGPELRRTRGRDINLQVEITITDQFGTDPAEKKVVSMLVADSTMGRIRASADAQLKVGYVGTGLNIDARPSVLEDDRILNPRPATGSERILLELTIEYTPFRETPQVMQRPTILNESLSVILLNGKSMVISQAADPVTDRKITVEVRATIAK